jgi:protein-disulfide isomerase
MSADRLRAIVFGRMCCALIARRFELLLAMLVMASLPSMCAAQELPQITAAGERAILAEPGIESTGARNADVTIVEYFDYACPYCRRIAPTFKELLATDGKIALVYKDWPVLGEVSKHAARLALAARYQGKYFVAHDALLAAPLSQDDQVEPILRGAGIDLEKLKKDLTAHSREITALLARNDAEARALEFDGTPGIVVGRTVLPGGADLSFFQRLIAGIRREGK